MVNTLIQRILQHQFLSNLRIKLLHLHKMLLNVERITYEQVRGNVSRGELLQLVINHDRFAWLHQLSQLILQIDNLLNADEPVTEEAIATLITDVRTLLAPNEWGNDFAIKYDAALQRSPDVVLAHADVVKLITSDFQP
ncbi:hypothetical protein IQ264_00970 [Phormidium sp. LEGE 05292]|uniref:hypothetical protein n=1 Tax=[Phormidium] sp. LEGE 05292 TaxID=767427 RepID=UPI00187F29F3|nr:hypothetical protein [Phormidium sp. LEGE 05292]MBE9224047.1 hypothetical protein [Phormidium sp. LEGE 05292]